jgi:transposase
LILDALFHVELSVAEQRYRAVMAVIGDGLSISQVAGKVRVSRQGGDISGDIMRRPGF